MAGGVSESSLLGIEKSTFGRAEGSGELEPLWREGVGEDGAVTVVRGEGGKRCRWLDWCSSILYRHCGFSAIGAPTARSDRFARSIVVQIAGGGEFVSVGGIFVVTGPGFCGLVELVVEGADSNLTGTADYVGEGPKAK